MLYLYPQCWGKGYYGKNGQGSDENVGDEAGEMGTALAAVPLGTGRSAHAVVGGRDYNCVLLVDGDIKVGICVSVCARVSGCVRGVPLCVCARVFFTVFIPRKFMTYEVL